MIAPEANHGKGLREALARATSITDLLGKS
jgi:hypothetical protein